MGADEGRSIAAREELCPEAVSVHTVFEARRESSCAAALSGDPRKLSGSMTSASEPPPGPDRSLAQCHAELSSNNPRQGRVSAANGAAAEACIKHWQRTDVRS